MHKVSSQYNCIRRLDIGTDVRRVVQVKEYRAANRIPRSMLLNAHLQKIIFLLIPRASLDPSSQAVDPSLSTHLVISSWDVRGDIVPVYVLAISYRTLMRLLSGLIFHILTVFYDRFAQQFVLLRGPEICCRFFFHSLACRWLEV